MRVVVLLGVLSASSVYGVYGYAAPGQTLALDVLGSASNPGKVQRCQDVARRHGFTLAADAPVHVALTLQPGNNHLTVTSRRGRTLDEPRPGWGMEQLCEDAMQAAERAYGGAPAAAPIAVAPRTSSGGTSMAIDVVGPASNPGKVQRCLDVLARRGVTVTPGAPLHIILTLSSGGNRLQIQNRRGTLYDQPKPGWGMEQLCEDAVQQALAGGPNPASATPTPTAVVPSAPPPEHPAAAPAKTHHGPLVLGPIPPAASLAPAIKTLADNAIAAWQGADFLGARNFFREAEQQSNDPQFLYDEAVCEQKLDDTAGALKHVQAFLKEALDSPYRPYATQLKGELAH